jgi:hypothetical protein
MCRHGVPCAFRSCKVSTPRSLCKACIRIRQMKSAEEEEEMGDCLIAIDSADDKSPRPALLGQPSRARACPNKGKKTEAP